VNNIYLDYNKARPVKLNCKMKLLSTTKSNYAFWRGRMRMKEVYKEYVRNVYLKFLFHIPYIKNKRKGE